MRPASLDLTIQELYNFDSHLVMIRIPELNPLLRAKAAGLHLLVSLAVALGAAVLVFGLWYPWPYRVLSGGRNLFVLLTSVDMVLGPLLTFAVFDPVKKGWRQLRTDLAVIVALQLAALAYGLYTVYQVRPVALVFEQDRFRVITATDIYRPELPRAPEAYRRLPLTGPWILGTRKARDTSERNEALFMGIGGIDIGQRPSFWQPYALSRQDALAKARPVELLLKQYPAARGSIDATVSKLNLSIDALTFLPVSARQQWIALLDKSGDVVGFAPFDGFF